MSDWEKIKFGSLGKHYGGLTNKTKGDFGKGKPYVPYLNVYENAQVNPEQLELVKILKSETQNLVKKGDILFTTSSETPHEVGMTSVLLDNLGELYLNSFCFGFRLEDFNTLLPEYAVHLFHSVETRKDISDLAQGSTRYNLSKSIFFEKLYLNLPPLPQQHKIAKILSTCDKVISKTKNAIAKYQDIKQGMITDLFTRGIDVNTGKLRPSYQENPELYKQSELGWIPKDWDAKKLSDISKINQGLQIAISNRFKKAGDNRYLYITIQYLHNIGNKAYEYYIVNPLERVICGKDDILMVRTGNTGQIVSNIEGAFHNNFFKIVYDDSVQKDYLIYHLKREVIQNLIMNYAGTTTIPDLKHRDFYKLPIDLPSFTEQSLIVKRLQTIDTKIQTEKATLKKYQQIKAGLMQDLLTGKVQVKINDVA